MPYLTRAHLAVQSHDLREVFAAISAGSRRDPTRILVERVVRGELGVGAGALNQTLRGRKKATKKDVKGKGRHETEKDGSHIFRPLQSLHTP